MWHDFVAATNACTSRVKLYSHARHAENFKNILAYYFTLATLHFEWYILIGGDICTLASQGDDTGRTIAKYMK